MADLLRLLRVGTVNVLGITVPGLLLILFLCAGFLLPLACVGLPVCQEYAGSDRCVTLSRVASFWDANKVILLVIAVVLAYVVGYVVRLSTPDDLDRISADNVLVKMAKEMLAKQLEAAKLEVAKLEGANFEAEKIKAEKIEVAKLRVDELRAEMRQAAPSRAAKLEAAESDSWPYRGEGDDKFPYFHFGEYLKSRGLTDLASLVQWGPPQTEGAYKRSKTHINVMKLRIARWRPELSAIVESNEAHVRLLFGTWVAIRTCWSLVLVGTALGIAGLLAHATVAFTHRSPPLGVVFVLSGSMLLAMWWTRRRIEDLFHYQRVRELFHIVACADLVRGEQGGKACTDRR